MLNTDPQRSLPRIVAGLAGLAMIGFGCAPIFRRGDVFSANWFGELVFAPLAITFGFFTIGCHVQAKLACRKAQVRASIVTLQFRSSSEWQYLEKPQPYNFSTALTAWAPERWTFSFSSL